MYYIKKLVILIILQAFIFSSTLAYSSNYNSTIHNQSLDAYTYFIDGSVYYNNKYIFTFMGINELEDDLFDISIYDISYKMNKIGYGVCYRVDGGYRLEIFITSPRKNLKYFNVIYLTT